MLTFRYFDAVGAGDIRHTVELIHREAYADAIARGDSFETGTAPLARFDAYRRRPRFALVVAYADGEPVGQSWGWPLLDDTSWWQYLVDPVESFTTHEDGRRTFALSELMVRQRWAGQGVGRALHDEFLRSRGEARAVLLVRPDNTRAYGAYRRWGWETVGKLDWSEAPVMDVLVRPLPGHQFDDE